MITNSGFHIEKTTIKHQPLIVNDEPSLTNPVSQMATDTQCLIVLNYNTGSRPFDNTASGSFDRHIDVPPWCGVHLKVQLEQYVSTSLRLLIKKAL